MATRGRSPQRYHWARHHRILAGVLVLLYRPFRIGDRISVTGLEGTVAMIDLRYTSLETEDKTYLIPNASLFTNPIIIAHKSAAVHTPSI